jgi:hypothetical protein
MALIGIMRQRSPPFKFRPYFPLSAAIASSILANNFFLKSFTLFDDLLEALRPIVFFDIHKVGQFPDLLAPERTSNRLRLNRLTGQMINPPARAAS